METSNQAKIFTNIIQTLTIKAINSNSRKLEASMVEGVKANNKALHTIAQVTSSKLKKTSMIQPVTTTAPKLTAKIKNPTGKTCTKSGKRIKNSLKSNRERLINSVILKKRRNGLEGTHKRKKIFIRSTITEGPTRANMTIQLSLHQTQMIKNITIKTQTSMLSRMVNTDLKKKKFIRNTKLVKTLTSIRPIEAINQDQTYLTVGIGSLLSLYKLIIRFQFATGKPLAIQQHRIHTLRSFLDINNMKQVKKPTRV